MTVHVFTDFALNFHRAALSAKSAIDAIPEDIDVDDEVCLIDAASSEVTKLAEEILSSPAHDQRFEIAQVLAHAWLNGTYWREAA